MSTLTIILVSLGISIGIHLFGAGIWIVGIYLNVNEDKVKGGQDA